MASVLGLHLNNSFSNGQDNVTYIAHNIVEETKLQDVMSILQDMFKTQVVLSVFKIDSLYFVKFCILERENETKIDSTCYSYTEMWSTEL